MKTSHCYSPRRAAAWLIAIAVFVLGGAILPHADVAKAAITDTTKVSAAVWAIEEIGEVDEVIDADVCVVGGGGVGLAAAIEATQLGLKPILIEKKAFTGGSFIGSEGLFAVGSHWQAEAGETAKVEDFVKSCMEFHHWMVDPELYTNFFSRTAGTIDWLEALGVKFSEVRSIGHSPICWHLYDGNRVEGTGVTFMKSFRGAADNLNIPIRVNLAGKKLIMKDGKVAGIYAVTNEGKVVQINAPVVIVGTGGYADNFEMIHELNGCDTSRIIPGGVSGRDGDGLKMMRDAGAAFAENPGTVMFYGPITPETTYGSDIQAATAMQPILWINQDAERFCNEALFWENFSYAGNAIRRQDKTFTIINKALIDKFANNGAHISVGVYYEAPNPMPQLWSQIEERLDANSPYVHVADSIEQLAEMIQVDPVQLSSTLKAYNEYCAAGYDAQFLKNPDYLDAMEEGPYYAFEVYNGYFCTVGGIKISKDTEVIDTQGAVIPGLYAGGNDAGGLYGECYDVGSAAGSQASWAVNSGRIAAQQAAAYFTDNGIAQVKEVVTSGSSESGKDVTVSDTIYKDGEYSGVGNSPIGGDISVKVTITNGKIASVDYTHNETSTIGGVCLPILAEEVVARNSSEVDVIPAATYTCVAFSEAVEEALTKAR